MSTRAYLNILFFTFIFSCFTSCTGYRLGNISGTQMHGVKTIYVPTVKNETYEPSIQTLTTNAIIERMNQDGTFASSRSKAADAIMEVTISEILRRGIRSSRQDVSVSQEYELVLVAQVTVTNLITGTRVLNNARVEGKTNFFLFHDAQEAERQQITLASQDLAKNIIKRIAEGW